MAIKKIAFIIFNTTFSANSLILLKATEMNNQPHLYIFVDNFWTRVASVLGSIPGGNIERQTKPTQLAENEHKGGPNGRFVLRRRVFFCTRRPSWGSWLIPLIYFGRPAKSCGKYACLWVSLCQAADLCNISHLGDAAPPRSRRAAAPRLSLFFFF